MPQNVRASASGNTITVSWQAPQTGAPITNYVVRAGTAPGVYNLVNGSVGAALSASGSVANGTYYISVAAQNATGIGPASTEITVVVGVALPGAPLSVTGSASGNTITVSWQPPATGAPITNYVVRAGTAPGVYNLFNDSVGAVTSVSAPLASGTYYISVAAQNATGVGPASADIRVVVGSTPPTPTPCGVGAPSILSASVAGTTVVYRWSAPTGTAPSSYVLEAGTAAGLTNAAVVDLGSAATTFTATNVAAGTYFVRLRSKAACGLSGPSNEIVVTVTGAAPTPTPPSLVGTWSGVVQLSLSTLRPSLNVVLTQSGTSLSGSWSITGLEIQAAGQVSGTVTGAAVAVILNRQVQFPSETCIGSSAGYPALQVTGILNSPSTQLSATITPAPCADSWKGFIGTVTLVKGMNALRLH